MNPAPPAGILMATGGPFQSNFHPTIIGFKPRDMTNSRLRRQIAVDAARMMYERQESEYYRAKMKAARRVYKGWVKPADLPSNGEIRDEIQKLARMFEGDKRFENLRQMRVAALRIMRSLHRFRPRLIGSVLTGHVRQGSDIDLHLFADSLQAVTAELDFQGVTYDVERKRVRKHGEETVYNHVKIREEFVVELTVYDSSQSSYVFKSSITGKAIERASIPELEQFLVQEYPNLDLDRAIEEIEDSVDRFQLYYSLLLPLENVKQSPKYHPEGDALYHSLQVYDLACDQLPYDEEFLLAALLHDVGKGILPSDHVESGLEALEGYVTERTRWLIEHHMIAHKIYDQSIGARHRKRLASHEYYEDLLLLGECDRGGRQVGAEYTDLEEALEYIRSISEEYQ